MTDEERRRRLWRAYQIILFCEVDQTPEDTQVGDPVSSGASDDDRSHHQLEGTPDAAADLAGIKSTHNGVGLIRNISRKS